MIVQLLRWRAAATEVEGSSDSPATEMEGSSDSPAEMEGSSDSPTNVEGSSHLQANKMKGGSDGPPPYWMYAVAEPNTGISDGLPPY